MLGRLIQPMQPIRTTISDQRKVLRIAKQRQLLGFLIGLVILLAFSARAFSSPGGGSFSGGQGSGGTIIIPGVQTLNGPTPILRQVP